jgi:hypothetical protein
MNQNRIVLALAVAGWWTFQSGAAPVPVPGTKTGGPITDALRLRELLPRTAPLTPAPAVLGQGDVIQMDSVSVYYVTEQIVEVVQTPQGRAEVVKTVTKPVMRSFTKTVAVADCKFFVVKDGKLEALDADKAKAMLKKKTAVLTGESADLDSRTLDVVKSGTLCVITLRATPTAPPPVHDEKRPLP